MTPTVTPTSMAVGESKARDPGRWVWVAAALFALLGGLVQLWRWWSLTNSYDQGIFNQLFWNSFQGHWFESSLSSQLSSAVIHGGGLPDPSYRRLGQHFTPALLLWLPLQPLLGSGTLPLVQVGLMTAAGLVLHRLARLLLPAGLAAALACSFFAAQAVIGPTWCNFHDLCQVPLLVFLLLLAWREQRWWLLALAAFLLPLVREDTGVLLFGLALWLGLRQRAPAPLVVLLAAWGAGWTLLVTSVLMPLVSDDVSRRFMVENFGQYTQGAEQASSLEVLQQLLRQPLRMLWELISPPGKTIAYLAGQWLPLMFVPALSVDSWFLVALPLAGLLLAQGQNDPLTITIRYALLVAPGVFGGALFWWQRRPWLFERRRLRSVWLGCVLLSLLITLLGNPNRSLSFLLPDSLSPWVHLPLGFQWRHGQAARDALAVIPANASVAANTPLVPLLARRRVLVRFPASTEFQGPGGGPQAVDWIAADLRLPSLRAAAFRGDAREYQLMVWRLQVLRQQGYRPVRERDGVVVLSRTG